MYHNSGANSILFFLKAVFLSARTLTGDLSQRGGYDVEQLKSIAKVQVRRNAFICRRLSVTLSNNSSPPSFTLLDSICLRSLLLKGPTLEKRGILYLILLLNQYILRCDLKDNVFHDVKCKQLQR